MGNIKGELTSKKQKNEENVEISKSYIEEYVNTSLVDLVANKIRSNIYSGKYLPGQRLIVRELSEELGVSHTPVKDALNRLVSEGYVEALPRKSMIVKEYTNHDFIENLEIRLMCEIFCADEIIEKAATDKTVVKKMTSIWETMKEAVKESKNIDYETWVKNETKFHKKYMELCSNSKLIRVYNALDSNKQSYFAYLQKNQMPLTIESFKMDLKEHKEIIDSIEKLNKQKFLDAVINHLVRACTEYALDESSRDKIKKLREGVNKYRKL